MAAAPTNAAASNIHQLQQLAELLEAKTALDAALAVGGAARVYAWKRLIDATAALGRHEAAYILASRAASELEAASAAATAAHQPQQRQQHHAMLLQLQWQLLGTLAAAAPAVMHHHHHHHRYRSRYFRDAARPRGSARVLAVSDLHVDAPGRAGAAARAWVDAIDSNVFKNDVLIVAGDVSDGPTAARATLAALRPKFARVCYVPGNHELWCGGSGGGSSSSTGNTNSSTTSASSYGDSFARLMELRLAADELDVDVAPFMAAAGLVVAPLLSWYDAAFDAADPRPGRLRFDRFCRWPVAEGDVWQVMARLNAPYAAAPGGAPHRFAAAAAAAGATATARAAAAPVNDVVTASHFLPHPALPSAPGVPELRKAVGCGALLPQLAALGACAHVFGHTHINGSWILADDGGGGGSGNGGSSDGTGAAQGYRRRYTQHALAAALDASGGQLPGLAVVHDGRGPVHNQFVSITTGNVV